MSDNTVVVTTSHGSFTVALDEARAPSTVANFLRYVDESHYDETIFHRVIDGFMVQGGGYDASHQKRPTRAPVANEAHHGVKNERGTVAMARTSDPHSATAQFFVNLADNTFLNHKSKTEAEWGYTVFGRVVSGMEVVDTIAKLATGAAGPFSKDAPVTPVVIQSVRRAPPGTPA